MNLFDKIPDVVKIGIWGPPASGKTSYLVMLQFADRNGWNIRPMQQKARDLFISGTKLMRNQLEFVPATLPEEGVHFLPFEFEGPGGLFQKRKIFRVFMPECSGEYYEYPSTDSELVGMISSCDGILWLVDPWQIDHPNPNHKTYTEMIQEWLGLIHEVQGTGRLKHHMAFCLTKMDLPSYVDHFNNAENFCLNKLGTEVRYFLHDYCDPRKVEFFATSAIGYDRRTKQSNVNPSDFGALIKPAMPIGLFEPLRWLFSTL